MLDGDQIVYVAQVPSRHSMRMFTRSRPPSLRTAPRRKALLAACAPNAPRDLLQRNGMPRYTEQHITDPEEFTRQLATAPPTATP